MAGLCLLPDRHSISVYHNDPHQHSDAGLQSPASDVKIGDRQARIESHENQRNQPFRQPPRRTENLPDPAIRPPFPENCFPPVTNQLPHRSKLLADLPTGSGAAVLARGRASASQYPVEYSAFNTHYAVSSEIERKRRNMANRSIALHAQIGYRDPELTRKAWAEIYQQGLDAGQPPERYGICLDWSMGYRRDDRKDRQRGTGLIIADEAAVAQLTAQAPVAAHFGDFVLGFPAAVENTRMALAGGSTTIGNLGQYFTFRLPDWDDDIACTEATIEAIGLTKK